MFKFWKTFFCFAWMPLYLGGGSTSEANQAQTTDTQDNRIAAATDSANTNNSRGYVGGSVINSVTNNTLDGGAISKSFDFAKAISAGAASSIAASEGNAQATVISSLDAVKSAYQNNAVSVANAYQNSAANVAAAYQNTSDTLATAYSTAKAGEQKVLVYGALLIGGIVALKALGKAA
jgi:hypothetical protein